MEAGRDTVLMEALDAAARLVQVLEKLRADPQGPPVRAEGWGTLAERIIDPLTWPRLAPALDVAGPEALRDRWHSLMQDDPIVARSSAVLFSQWGMEAAGQGDVTRGTFWLEQSLTLFERVAADASWAKILSEGLDEAETAELTKALEGLVDHQLDLSAVRCMEALEARDWPLALMHWRLVASRPDRPLATKHREDFVGQIAAQASGLERVGASRGVGTGDLSALRLLLLVRDIEPDSLTLNRRIVEIGVKAAASCWALRDQAGAFDVVGMMEASLEWCAHYTDGWAADEVFSERFAQGRVFQSTVTRDPSRAVAILREALHHHPEHPTARTLLGEALAALAARRFGAERMDEARDAAKEASTLLPPSEPLRKLLAALNVEAWFEEPIP